MRRRTERGDGTGVRDEHWPSWGGRLAYASEADGIARPRTRRVMRVVGPAMGIVWAVFLLQPWQAAWDAPHDVERILSLVAIAALAVSFAWVVLTQAGPHRGRSPDPRSAFILLQQLVLVAVSCLAADEQGLVGLVFVCVSAVFLLRDPRALLVPVFAAVVVLVVPRIVPGWQTIDDLIISVFLASVAVYGFTQLVQRNRQLALAQDEVAVLAVERERERIARDMHDILGHSLTVIAVKAELAGKMFDVDADRARAEIAEVQGLARAALADVRGMVSATRAVTLAGELAGARQALDSAGVEADVPGTVDQVPDDLRELFAWAVREGTTNVLRHAAASRVRVTMTGDTLIVDDDGYGPANADLVPGNGLRGLTERARESRARVEVTASPLGGYRLLVTTKDAR
ncbi:sensor histidine kinase [Cellulomonas sp. ICMP 17802]|uniref:sensor histidine kinase n=1 Tax=Cellulomonas sp. ICMP 17802 TaxID=3239199 RepID=UPI00351B6EF8